MEYLIAKRLRLLPLFLGVLCSLYGFTFSSTPQDYSSYTTTDKQLQTVIESLTQGQSEVAMEKLYRYIDELEKQGDTLLIVESYMLLADILRDNGNHKKSTTYYNKILPLVEKDHPRLMEILFKKGGNYQKDAQVHDGTIDSAIVNYLKAIEVGKKLDGAQDMKAKIHANLSGVYYIKAYYEGSSYDQAIQQSKIAANYQKVLGNKAVEAGIVVNLGTIYYMQGAYQKALNAFQQAYDIVGYGQEPLQRQTRQTYLINMAYVYSAQGNYQKAYEFQDRYLSLNDSLQNEMKYEEIAAAEAKYNKAESEKRAAVEKAKRNRAEFFSYVLSVAIVLLLLGLYGLYKLFRLHKKNHALQIRQRQLLHQSKISELMSASQAKVLSATLDTRVEERKKIAAVLHDQLSALLSAANLHLYALGKHLKKSPPVEIEKTKNVLSEAAGIVRNLSHQLVSPVLTKFGLGTAVKDLCEKSSNSSLALRAESTNLTRFDSSFENKLFNIINELVNNMIKHSKATEGLVKMEQLNGELRIVVHDNGSGFKATDIIGKYGLGLSHVEARIKVLNGLIKFSDVDQGTRIFISVPIVY